MRGEKPAVGDATSQVHDFEPIRIVRLPVLTSLTDFQIHQWTKKELEPYFGSELLNLGLSNLDVSTPALPSVSLPYTGVLFDADLTNQGAMISPWSMGFGRLAEKDDWLDTVRELFQAEKNVSALRQFSQLRQAGPIDVWIGLPYPFEQKYTFGAVGRRKLDFSSSVSARIDALSWWIDTVLTAWGEGNDTASESAVRLRGFVWARGILWGTDKETLKAVAHTLHRRKLDLVRVQNENTNESETQGRDADITVIRPSFRQYRQSGSSVLYSRDKKVQLIEVMSPSRGEGEP